MVGIKMTKNDFFELISGVLTVPVEELSLESTPEQIAQWDSLAQVAMCTAFEQTLNIQFSMSDMLSIKSLSNLVDVLEKHNVSLG
jgi:acyl carrier protein